MRPWPPRDGALLHVRHWTRLRYDGPVVEAQSEVRKTPVDTGLQRVLTCKLDIEPATSVRQYVDYFGTRVHAFNLLEPHDAVLIASEAIVETRNRVSEGVDAPDDDGRPWSQRLAEYLHWSPAVPRLDAYREIEHRVSVDLAPEDFLEALVEIGATFEQRFHYDPDATDVHSSPAVLFEGGGGVCQDLAHAMIGVLRLAGVPSRYVSGYVYDPVDQGEGDRVQGASASHAWVQAWHPELGFVGIDPTNHKLVDWQYVQVAAGRDYTDVQPLRGVFVGEDAQSLEVGVDVARIG